MFKKLVVAILVGLSFGIVSVQYSYGEYPTKPIELVVTFGPGSLNDLVARLAAEVGKKYLKQPLIVINKPGGSGTVGVTEVINSKPDGYKILYLMNNYFATTVRTQKITFDPNYIIPLINLIELRQGLGVRADSPWKTINQLLDYGRQNPGKLRVGNGGRGNGSHICQMIMFKKAGVEVTEIPYVQGVAEMVPALLGGHLDAANLMYSVVKSHLAAETIRLLVTYSDQRYTVTPEIPCSAELGYERIVTYQGIYVHKDTPEDIKKTLFEAFQKVCQDPEFKDGLEQMGDATKCAGPGFINESIRNLEKTAVPIIKELGLYQGEPPSGL